MKNLLMLLILIGLVGCGTMTPKLEKFERPPKFPQACDWIDGKHECRSAIFWDHSSDSKSCISHQDFVDLTKHILELNHVIDLYEIQVDEWNKQ